MATVLSKGLGGTGIGNGTLCLQSPGSFHGSLQHKTAETEEGLRTAQNPEAGASPEEELPEAGKAVGLPRSKRGSPSISS